MAQHHEPVQLQLLGTIIAAVVIETGDDGGTQLRVDITSRDQDGKPWRDTAMFREHDMSLVAHAVLMAYEWLWRQTVPAQPEASSFPEMTIGRTNSGPSTGRQ